MNQPIVALIVLVTLALSGCQRPQGVQDVARLSLPLVVRLQTNGGALQNRMAVQRSVFQSRAAALAAREADARIQAGTIERDWRMVSDKAKLDQLTVLREEDASLLQDPLDPFEGSTTPLPETNVVDFGGLKKSIASLDRLKGRDRASFGDLLVFAAAVKAEVEKLEEQAPEQAEQPQQ